MYKLLRRFKIWQKLTVIGSIFLFPIGILAYFMFSGINDNVAFARSEIRGNAYQRPLEILLEDLIASKAGSGESPTLADQVDRDLARLSKVDRDLGPGLAIPASAVGTVRSSWENARHVGSSARGAAHADVIEQVRALIVRVGDSSKLILDPDLDSYYLMDVTLLGLPSLQVKLESAASQANRLATNETVSPTERAQFASTLTLLASEVDRVSTSTQSSLHNDGDFHGVSPTLVPSVTPRLRSLVATSEHFLEVAGPVADASADLDPATLDEAGRAALEASFSLWHGASTELDRLLQVRIDSYLLSRDMYLLTTLLALALSAGIALVISRDITRSLGEVRAVALEVAHGNLEQRIQVRGHDEVAQLAVSFNTMAEAIQGASEQLAARQLVLRRQVRTDDLTGLPNRRALYTDVPLRLAANPARRSALLLLDLDRFKEVNDGLGHEAGDRLLVQVGSRLAGQLRSSDLLARLGGDEFAILLDDADADDASTVAIKIRDLLARPFGLSGISVQANVSIGISVYPDNGRDMETLLRKAEVAMYKAKAGHTGHHAYLSTDDGHGDSLLRTLEELRIALTGDQLVLHYQPKVDLESGDVNGVECLVRWNHPTRGLLFPGDFLAVVEEAGLMHDLTQIVLEKALDQAAIWLAGNHRLSVAVNLSASSLVDADLPGRIIDMLTERGVPPEVLVLEITEECLMSDYNRARAILTQLHDWGVRISVDDFGTGYSSLSYLRDLPIDELKLDQSFVFPMSDDSRAAALVSSSIALAHSLDLRMVAEGVENLLAYTELARYGCDEAQGYYICRPVPAADVDAWLALRAEERANSVIG